MKAFRRLRLPDLRGGLEDIVRTLAVWKRELERYASDNADIVNTWGWSGEVNYLDHSSNPRKLTVVNGIITKDEAV